MSLICITRTPSVTPSGTPTVTPSISFTPTATNTITPTKTPTCTPAPTNTPTTSETPTTTPTITPSNTITSSPTTTNTPSPTSSPTPSYAWIKKGKFIGRIEGSNLIFEESLYKNDGQGFIKTIPDSKIVCAKIVKMGDGESGASIIEDVSDLLDNVFITSPYDSYVNFLDPSYFFLSDGGDPPFNIRKSEQIIINNKIVGYKYILTIPFTEPIEAILTKDNINSNSSQCDKFYIEYILLGVDEFFPTPSPTITISPTHTPTLTPTASNTPSLTCSSTQPVTPTKTNSSTPTNTLSRSPTQTATPAVTPTPTPSFTPYPTNTPTETIFLMCTPTEANGN
jgi:hypothetical protein